MKTLEQLLPFGNIKSISKAILTAAYTKFGMPQYPFKGLNINLDTKFGIEIEIENCVAAVGLENPVGFLHFWGVDVDNSLRNNGYEFRSQPIPLRHLEVALQDVTNYITTIFPYAQFTHRCSVHVHVNVRDMTITELLKFITLYSICEYVLFHNFAPERTESSFCIPVNNNIQFFQRLAMCIRYAHREDNEEIGNLLEGLQVLGKYSALSFFRIRDLGTVEFRHLSGTLDKNKILTWCSCIELLKSAAKRIEYKDIINDISSLNTSSEYLMFLRKIFGDLAYNLFPPTLPKNMISAAVSNIKLTYSPDIKIKAPTFLTTTLGKRIIEGNA